jgi:hypothetical protein
MLALINQKKTFVKYFAESGKKANGQAQVKIGLKTE